MMQLEEVVQIAVTGLRLDELGDTGGCGWGLVGRGCKGGTCQ